MPRTDHLNHKPDGDAVLKIEALRRAAINYETLILDTVPEGRERSLAVTKLEECRMWAIKGVVLPCPVDEIED